MGDLSGENVTVSLLFFNRGFSIQGPREAQRRKQSSQLGDVNTMVLLDGDKMEQQWLKGFEFVGAWPLFILKRKLSPILSKAGFSKGKMQ